MKQQSKSATRVITRLVMLSAWALALVGGYVCVATVLDPDSIWTLRGKVLVASEVPASLIVAVAATRWHSRTRWQRGSGQQQQQQRKPWRGNEYQDTHLDYSYLRDDPMRDAMQRTI